MNTLDQWEAGAIGMRSCNSPMMSEGSLAAYNEAGRQILALIDLARQKDAYSTDCIGILADPYTAPEAVKGLILEFCYESIALTSQLSAAPQKEE